MRTQRPIKINQILQRVDYMAFEELDAYMTALETKIEKQIGVLESISEQCTTTIQDQLAP